MHITYHIILTFCVPSSWHVVLGPGPRWTKVGLNNRCGTKAVQRGEGKQSAVNSQCCRLWRAQDSPIHFRAKLSLNVRPWNLSAFECSSHATPVHTPKYHSRLTMQDYDFKQNPGRIRSKNCALLWCDRGCLTVVGHQSTCAIFRSNVEEKMPAGLHVCFTKGKWL